MGADVVSSRPSGEVTGVGSCEESGDQSCDGVGGESGVRSGEGADQ